jgi:hypothetical protein
VAEVGWDGIEFSFTPKGAKERVNLEDTVQFLDLLSQNMKAS